jgi:hypothetical protein
MQTLFQNLTQMAKAAVAADQQQIQGILMPPTAQHGHASLELMSPWWLPLPEKAELPLRRGYDQCLAALIQGHRGGRLRPEFKGLPIPLKTSIRIASRACPVGGQ